MRKRTLLTAVIVTLLLNLVAAPVYATHNTPVEVSATVTPGLVALSVAGDAVYGILNLGETAQEPGTQNCGGSANPAFTATNDGNITGVLSIRGANATGVTPNWALVSATPGTDEYIHRFATDDNTCSFIALTNSVQDLSTGGDSNSVTATNAISFFLNLDMPTDVTTGTDQASMPVIVSISTP